MTHGSLFSGIGGFDLAAEWMGWTNVFHCEWNPFGQKVLKHYWPDAISYSDITKTDFSKHYGTIDIISGGFPCQPYSTAGKRLGKEDERHLWPEMLRAIREVSPRYVVGENVRGLTNWNGGVVFDEVQADLEAEGYEVLPFLLPACAVNAPHRRDRIWFIAHAKGQRDNGKQGNIRKENGGQVSRLLSESYVTGNGPEQKRTTANTGSQQLQERAQDGIGQDRTEDGTGVDNRAKRFGDTWNVTHSEIEQRNDRPATESGEYKEPRKPAGGRDISQWRNWPTESPICSGNDGLSFGLDTSTISFPSWRNESIKAAGNAIVPQVALQIFKAIEQYELLNSEQGAPVCDAREDDS